jgi:hypothetical protein
MTVTGKLSKVSKEELTITPKGGGDAMTLKLAKETVVVVDGKSSDPGKLKQGQSVRASYLEEGGEHTATKIEVKSKHAKRTSGGSGHSQQGGMGGSGSSGSGSSSGTSQ